MMRMAWPRFAVQNERGELKIKVYFTLNPFIQLNSLVTVKLKQLTYI